MQGMWCGYMYHSTWEDVYVHVLDWTKFRPMSSFRLRLCETLGGRASGEIPKFLAILSGLRLPGSVSLKIRPTNRCFGHEYMYTS